MNKKITIIIAVYNSAFYLEHCLHSLFAQTYNNIEYIFVDDGSNDSSIEIIIRILELYPYRKKQVKIISHKYNQGVSKARATGILNATGEYMIHCDPDDYVEINWCELLLKKALELDSDIVMCSYFIESKNTFTIKVPAIKGDGKACVLKIFNNVAWRPLWNKLIKSSIIKDNHILPFKNCNIGEDWSFIIRCLNYSKSITTVDIPLYHYCIRENSLTNNISTTGYLESPDVFVKTYEFLDSCKDPKYTVLSNYFKFIVKMRLRNQFKNRKLDWYKYNSECHQSILSFTDHKLFNRWYLRILLLNSTIYKLLIKFKPIRNSIFCE